MNERATYGLDVAEPREPDPDPRVIAMQRVVEAEKRAEYAFREAEERQKRAKIAHEELAQAREELHNLLGVSGTSVHGVKVEDYR